MFFKKKYDLTYRMAIYVSVGLMIAQQFSGHANILSYAPTIFEQSGTKIRTFLQLTIVSDPDIPGAGRSSALVATVILGTVKVIMTAIALFWIDRLGRRPLLIYGKGMHFSR